MRKTAAILSMTIVSAFVLSGCTMLPASRETGVGPEEYAEIRNAEEIKKENESLKEERDNLQKDYLELSKNNETMISKLKEAEARLDILEGESNPKFYSEKTDKNSITAYLNSNKDVLESSLRGIEIIDSPNEGYILFYTTGYGDNLNQLFIWNTGEKEPVLIDKAAFEKDGGCKWINDKYLLINTGNEDGYKILDVDGKSITGSFYSKQDAYLIPETATFIIQKPDTGTFALYDFISSKEQEIDLDYKNRYTSLKADEENKEITFIGSYTDEYSTEYSVEAVLDMEKMREKYGIASLKEAIEMKKSSNSGNGDGTAEPDGTTVTPGV